MSRFRNERITIALCPEQVAIFKSGRGQTQSVEELPVSETREAGLPSWSGSVTALADWLRSTPLKRAAVTLVLSNRFARFALLPWAGNAQGTVETQALANACLESQYGEMSGWTLRIDEGRYGQPRLVCAVETALLDALRGALAQQTCIRVEPYFATCWNRWRKRLGNEAALFAVAEPHTTVIASLKQGHWHSVRALSGAQDRAGLLNVLARESLLQGFAEPPACYVHAVPITADITAESLGAPGARGPLIVLPEDVQIPATEGFSAAKVMALIGSAA